MSNEVQKLLVYRDVLKWNKQYEDFSMKYRVNPYKLSAVSIKPNLTVPNKRPSYFPTTYRDPIQEAFSSRYIKDTISKHRMTPSQKFRVPQTSAQEIGWMSKRIANNNWNSRPKFSCYETHFANEYFKGAGESPFKSTKVIK